MKGNRAILETNGRQLLQEALPVLAGLLPPPWSVGLAPPPGSKARKSRPDTLLRLRGPDARTATLAVEAKSGTPSTDAVLAQVQAISARTGLPALLVVPYAGAGLRRACEEREVSYLDLTGWASIRLSSPAVVVRTTGALRDPRPARQPTIQNLGGVGAGRVIRSLLEERTPVGVRALAVRAEVAPGTVSKVLRALQGEGVLERSGRGQVQSVAKRALVERWARDYSFLRSNSAAWYLAPRGLAPVLERADKVSAVATGSLALRRYLPEAQVPVTALAQIALYVEDPREAAAALGLAATERATANVILAAPYDPKLLEAEGRSRPFPAVSAGQAVADLLTLPGRAGEEADQLMDALGTIDPAWR